MVADKTYYELMEDMVHADPYEEFVKEQDQYNTDINQKPWYLATPYTLYPGGREQAHEDACRMTALLQEAGWHVFSPIVNSHHVCKYVSKKNMLSHDFWLNIDFKYVKQSRGLIVCMMEGWKESFGVTEEIKLANKLNLPILYTYFMEVPKIG